MEEFRRFKRGTKIGITAGLVLALIVLTKLGVDGYGWLAARAEQQRIEAAREAELRRMAEVEAKRLREQVEQTQITMQEALSAAESADRLEDWVGKYKDAWGTDLRIVQVKGAWKGVAVESAGPDTKFGTGDDITREKTGFSATGAFGSMFGRSGREEVSAPEPEPPVEEKPKSRWWPF